MEKDIQYFNRDRRTLTFKYIEDGKYSFTDELNLRIGFVGEYEDDLYQFVDPSGGPFLSVGGDFLNGDEIAKIYRDKETKLIIFETKKKAKNKRIAKLTYRSLNKEIAEKQNELDSLLKLQKSARENELLEMANKLTNLPLNEWGNKYFKAKIADFDGDMHYYFFKCKKAKYRKEWGTVTIETSGISYRIASLLGTNVFVDKDISCNFDIEDLIIEETTKEEFDKVEDLYKNFCQCLMF